MNARISLLTLASLAVITAPASAGVEGDVFVVTEKSGTPSKWRIGVGYAPLFGLKTKFTGLGKFASSSTLEPLGGGVDYNYDDGFVHLDSSGNIGNQTWNWGYTNNSQYNTASGGSITMSQSNSLANGRAEERDDAMTGLELQVYYDMGSVNLLEFGGTPARWGFRGGIHYANINIENRDGITSDINVLTDHFNLNGVIAPLAPFAGSFAGPGPLISDSPTRTSTNTGTAFIAGNRELEVDLTTFNFGGYLEIPVSSKFGMTLEGGVSVAVASGSYSFVSVTTVPGLGTQTSTGRDSSTKMLYGLYLGVGTTYQIDPSWAVQMSGRYQFMEDFDVGANGSKAYLNFDSAFLLSTGVIYSF
ncbi:hypothetical protein [Rubritalea sp.]|uniref:hypothetical protein n=1 Tax=Rubritalea sp. TaxID=2109375 RepID=UPI003EF63216